MIPGRALPDPEESKTLVAEQSGLAWSLFGLFIAFFVGFAFRATFSPEKVTALVQKAAGQIHKDVKVEFGSAALSLSDGLFPELAVVINDVRATALNECWMKPELNLDQIRLPLEISELFRGTVQLSTVAVGHGELVLHSAPDSCLNNREGSREPAAAPAGEPAQTGSTTAVVRDDLSPNSVTGAAKRNPVENISIRSIRIRSPNERFSGFEVRRVRIKANPDEKTLNATGVLVLPVESLAGDYGSQADFSIDYRNLPEPHLKALAQGTWREGQYVLRLEAEPKQQTGQLEFQANHLPLSPLLALLRKQGVIEAPVTARQAWISFQAVTPPNQRLGPGAALFIRDLKLEGDLGEFEAKEISMPQLSPLQLAPFQMSLRGVKLERLFGFFEISSPSPIFGDLGTFNGLLKVQSQESFELSGEHSGLQFIFSNRGVRETQTLSLIGGRAQYAREKWDILIDRVRPLEGLFLGSLRVQSDKSWKAVNVHLDMDEMSLHPNVQKLMTGGGSLGVWSGVTDAQFYEGHLRHLKGQILVTDLLMENLAVGRSQVQISSGAEALRFDLSGKRLMLHKPSPLLEALSPFVKTDRETLESEAMKLVLESKDFKALKWKLLPLKIGGAALRSEGGWDEEGRLFGSITRSESGLEQSWKLQGTRSLPSMEAEGRP